MPSYLSSGVYFTRVDLSQVIAATATSIGAIVGASDKGPTDQPYLVTNTQAFTNRFGNPDPTASWMAYQAIAFLQESGSLYVQRVVGTGATTGGLLLTAVSATTALTTPLTEAAPASVPFSTAGGYNATQNLVYFYYEGPGTYSGNLSIAINSLNLPIPLAPTVAPSATGGTLGSGTFYYTITAFNSLGETMASAASSTTFSSGSTNSVVLTWNLIAGASGYNVYGRSSTNSTRALLFTAGSTTTTFTDVGTAIALTQAISPTLPVAVQATPAVSSTSVTTTGGYLAGGQTYSYQVSAVTASGESALSVVQQVVVPVGTSTNNVVLNWPTTANAISYNIYGRTNSLGALNFALTTAASCTTTNLSTTLTSSALFGAITVGMSVSGAGIPVGATVVTVTSSSSIVISLAATASSSTVALSFIGYSLVSDTQFIANASGLTYTDTGAINPQFDSPSISAYTTVFTVSLYDSTVSITNAIESYNCSLSQQTDSFGNQLEIASQINSFSTNIRVVSNAASMTSIPLVYSVPQTTFSTGAAGSAVTNSQVANAWTNNFNDKETITIRLLMDGGYCNPTVQFAIDAVCTNRMDCVAIMSIPSTSQSVSAALDYRNITLNLNSNRSALYTPDVYIQDNYNNRALYVPPSGHVAAVYARTDRVSYPWRAPAGLNRGLLAVLGLRYIYNQGMRDMLAPAQINYLRNIPGQGIAVWEQITLQGKLSAFSYVNVVRMFDLIQVALNSYLLYSVFEPNDPFLQSSIVSGISQYLQTIQNARGLTQYLVVCDSSNNPPQVTGQGQLNIAVYLTPTLPATKLAVTLVATQQGVQLKSVAAANQF